MHKICRSCCINTKNRCSTVWDVGSWREDTSRLSSTNPSWSTWPCARRAGLSRWRWWPGRRPRREGRWQPAASPAPSASVPRSLDGGWPRGSQRVSTAGRVQGAAGGYQYPSRWPWKFNWYEGRLRKASSVFFPLGQLLETAFLQLHPTLSAGAVLPDGGYWLEEGHHQSRRSKIDFDDREIPEVGPLPLHNPYSQWDGAVIYQENLTSRICIKTKAHWSKPRPASTSGLSDPMDSSSLKVT